ncbi:hypothetical protein JST56_04425 [Candidatus Dependentiae bacterium]|nr:hypothetical protein [Candidatus Dependentiae bacterium]
MNYKLRLLLLAALAVSSSAFATEFRTPYLSDRGPLRHSFKKLNKKKMNINTWSTVHTKEAHKAFLKHGTDSKELTALLFNKSTFQFKEFFPGADVPLNSLNYNPFMRTLSYSPKAKYFEYGATFGGRIDFPIWKEDNGCVKGRIGLRTSIPFRTIEVERQDFAPETSSVDNALAKVVKTDLIRVDKNIDGSNAALGTVTEVSATAYRLDFVASLIDRAGNSIFNAVNSTNPATPTNDGLVTIFGQNIAVGDGASGTANNADATAALATVGLVIQKADGAPESIAWKRAAAASLANNEYRSAAGGADMAVITANTLTGVATGDVAFFDNNTDYSRLAPAAAGQPARLPADDTSWLIFKRAANTNNDRRLVSAEAQTIDRMLQDRLRGVNQDPFTFLVEQGFVFDSYKRSGLGDIDLDVFYEHAFNKHMLAELVLGVRFPTGTTKNSCNNPYRAIAKLGNGEHFEVKLGANFAWDACKWFSLKLDLSYNFVLEGKEQRAAVFAGSTVKNIGPCTDADVDWGYFIGRLDFQFVHPKTCCLSTVLGYEIYYKTEDHLTFKKTTQASWLGEDGSAAHPLPKLDSKLARKNTESISHKARMESTYKANKYLDIFWGGAVTFAGQNVFRDMDAHGGFNVRF